MRGRALGAALLLASPAAWAHGGSVPPWIPLLILTALAGFAACLVVPFFVFTGEPIWVRLVVALGLTAADLFAWYAIVLAVTKASPGLNLPEGQANVVGVLLGLVAWILPAGLVAWKLARRR